MNAFAHAIGFGLSFLLLIQPGQITASPPQSDSANLRRAAHQALQAQDWTKAAQLYRRLTKLTPDSIAAWGNLGNALKHLGKYKEAAGALGRAEELAPHSPAVRLDLALVYIAAQQYREAIPPLQAGLQLAPDNSRFLQLLGLCQLNSRQYSAAVKSLKLARHGQPQPNLSLLYSLAAAEALAGQQAAATQTLQEMLRGNQNEPALHLLLGETLLSENRSAEAEVELRRAHDLDPKMAEAELWLGLAAQKQHRYSTAQRRLKAAVRLQPSCLKCLYELGATEYLLQHHDAAQRDLRHCITLAGSELREGQPHARTIASAWYYIGRVEMGRHHLQQAAADLQTASQLDPSAPAPHYQLGRALNLLGQKAAARKQFQIFQRIRQHHQQDVDNFYRESFQRALKSASQHSK